MIKAGNSISVAAGGTFTVKKGEIVVSPRHKADVIALELTFPVANSTGGNVALSAAQRLTLLAKLEFDVSYGESLKNKPYQALSGSELRTIAREKCHTELEKLNDATDGLATVITNSATANLKCVLLIPVGRDAKFDRDPDLRKVGGIGPTQAASMQITIRRNSSDTIASGLALSGAITGNVLPYESPAKHDQWHYFPAVVKKNESSRRVVFEDGIPGTLLETTNAHAAATFTNLKVEVDDALVHDNVTAAQVLYPINDEPDFPSAGLVSDVATLLFTQLPSQRFRDARSGVLKFIQNVQDMATVALLYIWTPITNPEQVEKDIGMIAKDLGKEVKAISLAATDGLRIPSRLSFGVPMALVTANDREWEQFAGLRGATDGKAFLDVPATMIATVKGLYDKAKAAGAHKTASAVLKEAVAMVPGAVRSGRGFRNGTSNYLQVFKSMVGIAD